MPSHAPSFRDDGAAAYITAGWLCSSTPPNPKYLYAFRTGSGSTTPPPPPPPAATDTVTITRAEYATSKRQLRVEAKSSKAGVTLKVYVTSTNQLIGTLASNGRGTFSVASNPGQITVKSSGGGSATATVVTKR